MIRSLIISLLSLLSAPGLHAQGEVLRSDFKIGLTYLRPANDYARVNDDKAAFGLDLSYYYQAIRSNPLLFGINIEYIGLNSRSEKFSSIDDDGEEFRVKETWSTHAVRSALRINYHFLQIGQFAPFTESHFGLQYFFTLSSWNDLDDEREFETLTEMGDLSPYYGLGLGVDYSLENEGGFYIKSELSFGQSTEHYSLIHGIGSDIAESAGDHYMAVESTTDMLTFEAGLIFRF